MKIRELLIEAGAAKCWPGYRKTGTQSGSGKNAGKSVNKCKKIGEDAEVEESGLQYYTGVKKHGKEYMDKAAAAGRDGASQKELGALKDKYSKAHKNKDVAEVFDSDKHTGTTHKGGVVTKTAQGIKHTKTDYEDGNDEPGAKRSADGPKSRYYKTPILDKDDDVQESFDELARVIELSGLNLTADEQFDIIEEMVESLALEHGVDAETIWEEFETVEDDELFEAAAWQKKSGKSKSGGLNAKGVASYRRANPGSKLQMAVTTKPSKLKKGSKAAKRRKSFCARMGGNKGPMKKPNGKPTRKALALRKWNC